VYQRPCSESVTKATSEVGHAASLRKAAEYRAMAETALTQKTRDTLLKLAADYEALAAERASQPPRRPKGWQTCQEKAWHNDAMRFVIAIAIAVFVAGFGALGWEIWIIQLGPL
jgi:hypothetical protein